MPATTADIAAAWKTLGVYITPGLGGAWPDLKGDLDRINRDRVAKLPFIPAGWLASVRDLQAEFPDDLVRLAPSMVGSALSVEAAPWSTQTSEIAAAWQQLFLVESKAVQAYAAQRAEEGKAIIAAAYADAAFWDRAYRLAVAVRDAPFTLVSTIFSGLGWKWNAVLVLGAAGALFYFRKRIAALLKGAG